MFYKTDKMTIKTFTPESFAKPFDGYMGVFNENHIDIEKKSTKSEMREYFENNLNYSWDGAIFWFSHELAQSFFDFIDNWYKTHVDELTDEMIGEGVSNLVFYMNTKNGMVFIDTQRDMDSVVDTIIQEFESTMGIKLNDSNFISYDDCHLTDNLVFGRDTNVSGNNTLLFLYDEGLLNESIFLYGLLNDSPENVSYDVLLDGKFFEDKQTIIDNLDDTCIKITKKLKKDTWVWLGRNVSQEKIDEYLKKNVKVSSMSEVIHYFHEKYFKD